MIITSHKETEGVTTLDNDIDNDSASVFRGNKTKRNKKTKKQLPLLIKCLNRSWKVSVKRDT